MISRDKQWPMANEPILAIIVKWGQKKEILDFFTKRVSSIYLPTQTTFIRDGFNSEISKIKIAIPYKLLRKIGIILGMLFRICVFLLGIQ